MDILTEPPLLHSLHLEITVRHNDLLISYEPPAALTLGSTLRARDIRGRVKSLLKRARPVGHFDDQRIDAWFDFDAARTLASIVRKIDLMLDAYKSERLTSKMVEEILGITAVEVRRWYKDRRLAHSGMASHRRGRQSFHLPLYAPEQIARLAANPGIVSQWREEDAAQSVAARCSDPVGLKTVPPLSTSER